MAQEKLWFKIPSHDKIIYVIIDNIFIVFLKICYNIITRGRCYELCNREKINELHTQKKVNQEDIASALDISRQCFARIEDSQSEISYNMIQKAAEFLGVPNSSITSVVKTIDLKLYFRDVESSDEINDSVEKI